MKTRQSEVRWFAELLKFKIDDKPIKISNKNDDGVGGHLYRYFIRKRKQEPEKVLNEIWFFAEARQGKINGRELLELQKKISLTIEDIVKRSHDAQVVNGSDWVPVELWENMAGSCLSHIISKEEQTEVITLGVSGVEIKGDPRMIPGKTFIRWSPDKNIGRQVNVQKLTTSLSAYLYNRFLEVISGIDIHSFKRCPECEALFIQAGKTNKIYCETTCATRNGARRRRKALKEESPEVYAQELKENAKRARKSYRKRVERKSGGKSNSNPYKYKKEE